MLNYLLLLSTVCTDDAATLFWKIVPLVVQAKKVPPVFMGPGKTANMYINISTVWKRKYRKNWQVNTLLYSHFDPNSSWANLATDWTILYINLGSMLVSWATTPPPTQQVVIS